MALYQRYIPTIPHLPAVLQGRLMYSKKCDGIRDDISKRRIHLKFSKVHTEIDTLKSQGLSTQEQIIQAAPNVSYTAILVKANNRFSVKGNPPSGSSSGI